jgi:alanine racemase
MFTTYTIQEVIDAIKPKEVYGKTEETKINHLLTDSRKVIFPSRTLFFAIRGKKLDGHAYVSELYEKGVRAFVASELPDEKPSDACFLLVENSIDAMQRLAAHHRNRFHYPVIGITGSNGKTIVKEWLFTLLQDDFRIVRSPKSYNSQIGVPLSVWMMNENNNLAIIEAGISEPGEMARLQKIIRPTVGIFTNIGEAHAAGFLNDLHKAREKFTLFPEVDLFIYCSDYPEINQVVADFTQIDRNHEDEQNGMRVYDWSMKSNRQARLQVELKERDENRSLLQFQVDGNLFNLEFPFVDMASIENAIHCVAFMLCHEYSHEEIQSRLKRLNKVAMRLELREAVNDCQLINDSYNSDLNSLRIALDFQQQQNQKSGKTLILSDILESGRSDIDLYQEVANLISEHGVDRFIAIGPAICKQKNQINHILDFEPEYFETTEQFISQIDLDSFSDELILLKGARKFRFERISRILEQKVHETVLEINLNAIAHNLKLYRNRLKPNVKIMAMVKAFSYGSGGGEIAHLLKYNRVDYLGVAYADEGVELRRAGVQLPIMVMNPEQHAFETMIQHRLEPELFSLTMLDKFIKALRLMAGDSLNMPFPIHLKLDTGMHRLGFEQKDLDRVLIMLEQADQVVVKSVFSHLSAAEAPEHDNFTQEQISTFKEMSQKLIAGLGYPVYRHILNSSGVMRHPDAQFDMVRLGIGLYGYDPTEELSSNLQQVSRLRSTVSQIKEVKKGETVGYSRMGVANEDMRIATIRVGYADGLDRRLSRRVGKMIINGKEATIVGNVCMDMCMVDITHIDGVEEGTQVIVFGPERPVHLLAEEIGTIPYEILTSISSRVKRVYFQE